MLGHGVTEDLRKEVIERDEYTCQNCKKSYKGNPGQLTVTQIEPLAESEGYQLDNLQTRCHRCAVLPTIPEKAVSEGVDNLLVRRLEALDQAATTRLFGDDSLQIVKIGLSIPTILLAVIGVGIKMERLRDASGIGNSFVWAGLFTWGISLLLAGTAYYNSRTSGTSPPVIEQFLNRDEDGLNDEESELSKATEASYKRNALLIASTILLLALTIVLFGVGILKALGLFG